ncbi:MAG: TIGR01459 family HAD-type hydrolase [Alphaproteobacteria bacterium]
MNNIELIDGLKRVALNYDALIIDLWGVIHDGVTLKDGVLDCLDQIRSAGVAYAFLSNAPRRASPLIDAMVQMGLPSYYSQMLLSSGEATHLALKERSDPWFDGVGRNCYHIGPERDLNLFDGLDLSFVLEPGDADLIVNTGPWGVSETVANYEEILQEGVQSRVKMVCANPDLEVIRGGRRMICAGALAERYEALGGSVIYYGKPKRPIYDTCLSQLGNPDPGKVLAIGDSLRTDIAGAKAIGMDSVLVLGGIHEEEFSEFDKATIETKIFKRCEKSGIMPTKAISSFCW